MKIAIYGGAFDPPTFAHEVILKQCFNHFDQVLINISNSHPDKKMSPKLVREMLVYLGLTKNIISLNDDGTFNDMYAKFSLLEGDELYFIIGGDNALSYHTWKTNPEINFCVISREGYRLPKNPWFKHEQHIFLNLKVPNISSTQIRNKIRQGESISGLVSPKIINFIKDMKLYI